jgi:sec-independent protein translocase protein TatB
VTCYTWPMFGLSFTEVVIIAVLALILLGPDQLPNAAKTVGKTLRELRRAADDLKDQISSEIDLSDVNRLGDSVSRLGDNLGDQLTRLGEPSPRPTLVQPVPSMPLPTAPAPEASAGNVPGLEAATAEPAPAEPAPADGAAPATSDPAAPRQPT